MYFGSREAKEKYGVSPSCAFFVDLSGASWSIVNLYPDMGVKYVGILPNGFRNSSQNENIPPIFWWEDKSGEKKVLLWYQRAYRQYGLDSIWCDTLRQYPEGSFYFDTTKTLKTERWFSERISKLEPCGYDILPISFYDDRETPTTMLLTVCEEMNKKWKYPVFSMEIPSVFMSEIAQNYGDTIPTFRGDISDQWADFGTISPELTSKKRKNMRTLYDVELLSVADAIVNNKKYDGKIFRDIYYKLSEFDEHCWATSSKHPQKMHRHNMNKVKRESVEFSITKLENLMNEVCPKADCKDLYIINTIPKKRKSRIYTETNGFVPENLNHQILPNGTVITEEVEFDSVSSKKFNGTMPYKKSNEIFSDNIETDYFKIRFNKNTKKIVSLIDKISGKEYIDSQARYELGQFIYAYTEQKTDPKISFEVTSKTDFKLYEGDIAYVLVQKGYEEQSGATVTSQLVFYKHTREIDIDLKYENATGLIGDFYDRYKKNYFFAFPFNIKNPKFYTEMQVGEKNEKEEYIPLNANDFSMTQNWIAIDGEDYGVAVYTRDMNVFHLGKIKYNQFNRDFSEDKGHIYLYASSNRCNNLLYTSIDQCNGEYHLSILLYNENHKKVVSNWSDEKDHRLLTSKRKLCDGQLLKISEDNVRLVSFKKAEDNINAIVMRFVETEGKTTKCSVDLFFKPKKVAYTTCHEEEIKNITEIEENRVNIDIKPYSYTTIKIYGDFN